MRLLYVNMGHVNNVNRKTKTGPRFHSIRWTLVMTFELRQTEVRTFCTHIRY